MKKITSIIILIAVIGFSCKSSGSMTKEQTIAAIGQKVESGNFSFIPQRAIPTNGRSVNISSFEFKVSSDTIQSYLPYYGRAYSAPMFPDDNGIKFVSTDFDYNISPKNKGMWTININTNDTRRKYAMTLNVGETGYTTLTVNTSDRQPISFYGVIQ